MRMILKKPFMVLLSILLAFNTSVTAVLALDSELPENPQDETALTIETETEEKEGNQDEQITVETEETQMVEEKEI